MGVKELVQIVQRSEAARPGSLINIELLTMMFFAMQAKWPDERLVDCDEDKLYELVIVFAEAL